MLPSLTKWGLLSSELIQLISRFGYLVHVIDHVVQRPHTQCYHEELKEPYIEQSELPDRLKKLGYDWRHFIDEDSNPDPLFLMPC